MSTTSPRFMYNYKDIITNNLMDMGFIMAPLSAMIRDSKKFKFSPLLKSNNKYQWNLVIDYYTSDLMKAEVPMHYCVEKVVAEWDIHVGMAECNRSWWLRDLAEAGLIPQQLQYCKLVCFCDDFFHDIPDERMYRRLWNNLFTSWMRKTGKDWKYIRYIDEILDWERYKELKNQDKLDYTINRGTFFNRLVFDGMSKYYRKY